MRLVKMNEDIAEDIENLLKKYSLTSKRTTKDELIFSFIKGKDALIGKKYYKYSCKIGIDDDTREILFYETLSPAEEEVSNYKAINLDYKRIRKDMEKIATGYDYSFSVMLSDLIEI